MPPKRARYYDQQDIKAMIWKKGSNLRQISLQAGLHLGTASQALMFPIPAGNKAIADFLGLSLHELWPHWYDQQDQRLTSYGRENLARSHQSVTAKTA